MNLQELKNDLKELRFSFTQ